MQLTLAMFSIHFETLSCKTCLLWHLLGNFARKLSLFCYFSMKKIINYLLSAIFLLYFGIVLVLFHVIQVICFELLGKKAHQKSVNALNFFLVYGLYLTGTIPRFTQSTPLPTNRPLIFVANHQSTFDIPGIIWFLRKYTPLFVSKIELAKGIPSISYNLRVGGAALIDRKDPKQALPEIKKVAELINSNNYAVVIFPEGTRSKNGLPRPFASSGLKMLYKFAPELMP